ncbi:hypothetical protein ACFT9I_23810 [Streptomyces sp. NPDC057137]|uniref:hypothetical protein n=1 Tax=Streptomyces sp. NPDC057137 TaxID=3346030 RepID=UPI00362DD07D
MTTRADDGPEFDPDDPLAVILRPPSDCLGPPPRRYETIRRSASRRRLLRAAAGVGLSCAAAALVALPFHLATTSDGPAPPTVPLAPPPASSYSPEPTAPPSPGVVTPSPSGSTEPGEFPTPSDREPGTAVPSDAPMPQPGGVSVGPSAVQSGTAPTDAAPEKYRP